MRIKLDENLPAALAGVRGNLGHDVETVPGEQLAGETDSRIWSAARAEGRLLVTQDLDFSDARAFSTLPHPGLLLIRLRRPGQRALIDRVTILFAQEDVERWTGSLVIATDSKIRVRKS